MHDLLICIRCHDYTNLVVDTMQSVAHNTSPNTQVVFAADGQSAFSNKLISLVGKGRVYVSNRRWGWGPGLFSLLVESYLHFNETMEFSHYMSIDYDTLFIGPEVDSMILSQIKSPKVGLLGCQRRTNEHWESIYHREEKAFTKVFGEPGPTYRPGEGVQGGFMTLTQSLLVEMGARKMFSPPYSIAKDHTTIADDHLLPIFVRMCGLDIVDVSSFACCHWKAPDDPRGMERKGVKVFHPTKLLPGIRGGSTEIEIRNYFRQLRGCSDLLR